MGISHKGWFVFSQLLCLLVALSGFVVAAVRTAPGGRLEIDTLIANILVKSNYGNFGGINHFII